MEADGIGAPSAYKSLHKFTTPPWKETYKKRCIENLRKSRQKFLNRFRQPTDEPTARSVVKDVMTEEWTELRKSHTGLPTCTELLFGTDDEEITYLNSIIEEIQTSLRLEEENLLELYYQDYEKNLCSAVDNLTSDDLICPVCQKHPLLMNKGVIICQCGLRINTEQDALTLDYTKQSMERGIQEHDGQCGETAAFSKMNSMGIDNLLMTCEACDFMYIVI